MLLTTQLVAAAAYDFNRPTDHHHICKHIHTYINYHFLFTHTHKNICQIIAKNIKKGN